MHHQAAKDAGERREQEMELCAIGNLPTGIRVGKFRPGEARGWRGMRRSATRSAKVQLRRPAAWAWLPGDVSIQSLHELVPPPPPSPCASTTKMRGNKPSVSLPAWWYSDLRLAT